MKKNYIILSILLLSFSISTFSQKKSQIAARVNFSIAPIFEFTKIAGDYNLVTSISGNIIFNSKVYLGGYISKKILPVLHTDFIDGQTNDISVQHFGITFGSSLVNIRSKNSYVLRKTKMRFTYGVRVGGGALWLNDNNWSKVSSRDYFYIVQPSVGMFRSLGDYVIFSASAYFQATYGVGKVGPFLTDKDFMSPGIYTALYISLFK